MKLRIEIDLDGLPYGVADPYALGVILGELREWVESFEDVKEATRTKTIRNFESQVVGLARIG